MKDWNELLEHEVQDLYDAERQLIEALPKMAQKAASPELKMAFEEHTAETEIQAQRLEQVARILGIEDLGKITCEGMKGLIKEGEGILKEKDGDPEIIDFALIGAAQKVEHYEMVAYQSVIHLAEQLGLEEVADLLQETMNEEIAASDKLSELSGEEELDEEMDEAP